MIQAVTYDMDGVVINSEPLWRKAQITVFNQYGVSLSEEMCKETMGLRVDEVIAYWAERHTLNSKDFSEIEQSIMDEVIALVTSDGDIMPGIIESLDFIASTGVVMALASSSPMRLIDAVVNRFKLRDYFSVIYSAEIEEYGKPHPGVYIHTAQKMSVPTGRCIAIEDSINGIVSAKAAKMECVAIPDSEHKHDKRLGIADVVLDSLHNVDDALWQNLAV